MTATLGIAETAVPSSGRHGSSVEFDHRWRLLAGLAVPGTLGTSDVSPSCSNPPPGGQRRSGEPGRSRVLIVTRGLPGCGKTTRALRWVAEDPQHRARVGSDQIAAMLHPDTMANHHAYGLAYAQREQLVVNAAIAVLLDSRIDVVCDDTFLHPHYLDTIRDLATQYDAHLIVWNMTDVGIEECIARDRKRGQAGGRMVGEHQIRIQNRLLRSLPPAAAADPAMRRSALPA